MKQKKKNKLWNRAKDVFPPEITSASRKVQEEWSIWYELGVQCREHPEKILDFDTPNGVKHVDCGGVFGRIKQKIEREGGDGEAIEEAKRRFDLLKLIQVEKQRQFYVWKKLLTAEKGMPANTSLLEIKKDQIIELFGQYHTQTEIFTIINKEWQINVSMPKLAEFKRKYEVLIEKRKTEFVLQNKDFRVATDTGRMEDLSKLLFHWNKKFESHQSVEISREIRAILEQARKEVKGDEIKLTVDGRIDIETTKNANMTMDQVFAKLPINLMIIGLVAARAGLDPTGIQASLTNSYYSKFNGFNKLELDEDVPSMQKYVQTYNWETITEAFKGKEPDKTMVDFETKTSKGKKIGKSLQQEAKDVRNEVLKKIANLKSNRNKPHNNVEDIDHEEID